ncbi:hypothetical protein LS73_008430 [Helicobacter muridarum]|uniref:Aminoglycoside N(3)-acetyltransferase n=1 Tax=Helicobacter muridarum TaxID=216 RepID=A0A377PRF4_9HELI|nr:AAC(3) family N-acetyltransferase [Helicobacter muridarum]TLD98686.1 hypothetical protein LS73_008430 [Helicobacter muridarum]STQ85558.1 Aminoglycoside 3-N-acetyltransferase [Helicobacter muridarum]
MKDIALFESKSGLITKSLIKKGLSDLKANECDYLFIHSALNFGIPMISKKEILKHISDILLNLDVKYLIIPTFTFSFCNKEDFDISYTKSSMGILNENLRKLDIAKRTRDPLLSVAIIPLSRANNMSNTKYLLQIGKNSCGKDSIFDKLHQANNGEVKFLFFGNRVHDCFTHSHYVEEQLKVPYRYDKEFSGYIIDGQSKALETFTLPVRYHNVEAFNDDTLSLTLDKYNAISRIKLGNASIEIIEEKQAYKIIKENIQNNIDFMLAKPYPRENLDSTYIYEKKVAL